MFDDVRDVDPAVYAAIPVERVVAKITRWGRAELEFCFTDQYGTHIEFTPPGTACRRAEGSGAAPRTLS
jgi:hypothetical protein